MIKKKELLSEILESLKLLKKIEIISKINNYKLYPKSIENCQNIKSSILLFIIQCMWKYVCKLYESIP